MTTFNLTTNQEPESQLKYCTDFIIHGWACTRSRETFMVEYHDTKNVESDTQECQDYLSDYLWDDIEKDGFVWFCHHVTVTFHTDYWREADADVDCNVISQKKCASFGELRGVWRYVKQYEGID